MMQIETPPSPSANPDAAPLFTPLAIPAQLWVPSHRDSSAIGRAKPPGTLIQKGGSLFDFDDASSDLSSPLSPAAGRILETAEVALLGIEKAPAVLLEVHDDQPPAPLEKLDAAAAANLIVALRHEGIAGSLERLKDSGIWADRWTSPNLLGQLRAAHQDRPDIVACSLLDVDPALPLNAEYAHQHGPELLTGVMAIAAWTGAKRIWIVVAQSAHPAIVASIRDMAASVAPELQIIPITNDYPQPNPTLLLRTLTGRDLLPGRLPTDRGLLLLDAVSAVAIGQFLAFRRPMLDVPLAIHDQSQGRTHLVKAAIGTPVSEVLRQTDVAGSIRDLRAGSPLRELRVRPEHVVAATELCLYAAVRQPSIDPLPCIRCGWCVEGCPVAIRPPGLLEAAQTADPALADHYGLQACIECGICTYVCPSHLPLLQSIRQLRTTE